MRPGLEINLLHSPAQSYWTWRSLCVLGIRSSRTDSQLFSPVMLDTPALSLHSALKSEKFVSPDAQCLSLYTNINENSIFCQFRISTWQLLVKNKKYSNDLKI